MLINEGDFTSYPSYTTDDDFISWVKGDIDEALDNLYYLQNNISLSKLSMLEAHSLLILNKTINLYFQDYGNT